MEEPELTEEQAKLQEEIAELLKPYLLMEHTENKNAIFASIIYGVVAAMLADGESLENISKFFADAAGQRIRDIKANNFKNEVMANAGIQ